MSDAAGDNFPRFSRVHPVVPEGVPERVGRLLREDGVPASLIGLEYVALDVVNLVPHGGPAGLAAFGSCGLNGRVCLDIATARVVHIADMAASVVNPVNSNLDLFVSCVSATIARFPFYGEGEAGEEAERVADELSDILLGIDPEVSSMNGFWQTFIDDVAIGDYSTEVVAEVRNENRLR